MLLADNVGTLSNGLALTGLAVFALVFAWRWVKKNGSDKGRKDY
jgi:hypothetical protein